MPDLTRERRLGGRVAGLDEAGRGPIAGPVVAAAVVLPDSGLPRDLKRTINDSKQLLPEAREEIFAGLGAFAEISVAEASVDEIDIHNILQASMIAMSRAAQALSVPPEYALVDGNRLPILDCPGEAVVEGDTLSLSIAAASIAAKVTRDRGMRALAESWPGYGWETNVGYATPEHLTALARLGPTEHHRRSFAPVAEWFLNESL